MNEAMRDGLIRENPWKKVVLFEVEKRPRGILTIEEAKRLLNPSNVQELWNVNRLYWLASLIAAITAMRQGEILSLKKSDVYPDHLHVDSNWDIKYGEGPTKTRRVDDIPNK